MLFRSHMMPEMDGIDTTVAIRALEGEYYANVPIIALTANAISGVREMFKAEGLNDYLAKPIEISKLNAIINQWIPKEKQFKVKATESSFDENEAEIEFDIYGVNAPVGIKYAGGSVDTYHQILKTYVADGEKHCVQIAESFDKADYKLFTIYAHALKSASANIGAEELSREAAELEFAGKNNDIDYIRENFTEFMNELSSIVLNIKTYLQSCEASEDVPVISDTLGDLVHLKEKAIEIEHAIENVDFDAVEIILDELFEYKWDESIFELLNRIKTGISMFDYDDVESALHVLLDEADDSW